MFEMDWRNAPAETGGSGKVRPGPLEFEFFYEMQSEFDREIEGHNFRLMCFPADSQRQKVQSVSYEILPHTWLSEGRDSFGNLYIYGRADGRHNSFTVRVHGTVETGRSCFEAYEDDLSDLFRHFTPATAPGDFADAYFRETVQLGSNFRFCSQRAGNLCQRQEEIPCQMNDLQDCAEIQISGGPLEQTQILRSEPQEDTGPDRGQKIYGKDNFCIGAGRDVPQTAGRQNDYETALYFMKRIHEDFSYQKGVSDTNTTSEQTFEKRMGVCQDFAHVLITLCRMAGIAARYAAGIMEGEGETHAWAEILSGGKWYGLDPTNNCVVDGRYIKFSHGRDCRDCLVNRGIYFNPARETQKIRAHAGIV